MMRQWSRILSRRDWVGRLNQNLFASLTHCPILEIFDLSFRCIECHIESGTLKKGAQVEWHLHPEHQLEIPLAGAFSFEAASGKKVLLSPGQALLIPLQVAHRWECIRSGPIIGISLDPIVSARGGSRRGSIAENFELVTSPLLRQQTDDLIAGALLDRPRDAFHAKVIASRLFLLLAEIVINLPLPKSSKATIPSWSRSNIRGRESVGRVIAYLDENYGSHIRLDRIAAKIGMSDRHLHRLFLRYVGKSVHDFLLDHRLENARQLLMEQGRNYLVKEIASRCGFRSPAYFASAFGKAFGASPLAYRANRGGGRHNFRVCLRSDRKKADALAKGRSGTSVPRK